MENKRTISHPGPNWSEYGPEHQILVLITCVQKPILYRGSYMSAHVLLNLLELRKRDKMQGWQTILSLFRNEFNKTRA